MKKPNLPRNHSRSEGGSPAGEAPRGVPRHPRENEEEVVSVCRPQPSRRVAMLSARESALSVGLGRKTTATGEVTLVEELKLSQPVGSKPSVASKLRGYVAAATAASTFKSKNHQSSELEERRLEVRRAKLRSYSWLGISVVAGLLVVGGLVWAVFFSTLFALNAQQITVVKGSEKVSPAQVQTILRKWDGVPLPRVSTGNMEAELASIPLVKSAEVSRSWPNGLEISLDLRVPVFSVEEAGQWQIYDTEGVQIETSPVIAEGTLRAELTATDPQKRVQALQLMAQVRSQLDVELLEEVAVLRSEGSLLEIVLNSGAVVKWGDASDTPFKLKVLKVLLGQVPAKLYDVSVPAKPVTA